MQRRPYTKRKEDKRKKLKNYVFSVYSGVIGDFERIK